VHELGATQTLLRLALEQAAAAGARRVTDVHISVGRLSDVSPEAIRFYWPEVSRDTSAEGARLHFRRESARVSCRSCGRRSVLSGDAVACPRCQAVDIQVIAGDATYLRAIDVERGVPPSRPGAWRTDGRHP